MVRAFADGAADRRVHRACLPDVWPLLRVFGLITSAIAATAFRRGDAWAWWTLLAGNVVALPAAMKYDWTVNAIGAFELTEYLGLAMILVALAVTAPFGRQGGARLAFQPAGCGEG